MYRLQTSDIQAPLTLIRCRCVHSLLPLLLLAANTHTHINTQKKVNNMQPTDPKDLSLSRPPQLSHSHGSVGPRSLAVVRKAGNSVTCVTRWFVYLNRFLCCAPFSSDDMRQVLKKKKCSHCCSLCLPFLFPFM